jgi:hypothetical protein
MRHSDGRTLPAPVAESAGTGLCKSWLSEYDRCGSEKAHHRRMRLAWVAWNRYCGPQRPASGGRGRIPDFRAAVS